VRHEEHGSEGHDERRGQRCESDAQVTYTWHRCYCAIFQAKPMVPARPCMLLVAVLVSWVLIENAIPLDSAVVLRVNGVVSLG
jgi:hypothetical protein